MSKPDSIKVDQNEETVTEILEPAAELDKKIILPVKETRNQAIRYILWGLISVAVNFATFYTMYHLIGLEYQVANVISWVIAVQVAFWVDRLKVFDHHSHHVYREMGKFYATRIVTYVVEAIILWLLMSVLGSSAVLAKILGQAGAIIGNFLFSKLYVFRNK
ncbi:GtrA family protein [Lactiplantibacillus plantarum]|uniref:GtrA family protein n=1 Tax=Lactiplantibacillus plantarum TaxID=1590 RepID=UPI000E0965E4|nr:GtrA family protein [Lactiplantibacillus plantarum]RDF82553.1 GtrA family protein [Lactiplantibacillus plantarum]